MRKEGIVLRWDFAVVFYPIDLSKNVIRSMYFVFWTFHFERKIESRLRTKFEIDIPGVQDWTLSIVV